MKRNLVKSRTLLLSALLLSICGAARAQADDPVTEKLTKAKEAYTAAEDKFHKAVLDRLQTALERATKDGKKALVDQISAERDAFENNGTLPKSFKSNDLVGQRTRDRLELLAAYNRAVTEFTKKRMRSEADAAEREMIEFKARIAGDQIQSGTVWRGEKKYLKGGPAGVHPFELRVTERNGNEFKGIITEDAMSHDVEGVVENDKVSWKIARVRKGAYPGQPQSGTFEGDVLKLHFARRDGTGSVVMVEAVGTIKLQKKK
jgi:hypothetical protein